MSWQWIVRQTDDGIEVDWTRGLVATAVGVAIASVLFWIHPLLGVVVPLAMAPLAIWLDVRLRAGRGGDESPQSAE